MPVLVTMVSVLSYVMHPYAIADFPDCHRCQGQERRLNVLMRTTEGEFGDLLVTVVSGQTPKAAKVSGPADM